MPLPNFYSLIAIIPGKYHEDQKGLYSQIESAKNAAKKLLAERIDVYGVGIYNIDGNLIMKVER